MKSHLTVLLSAEDGRLRVGLDEALEPFRLDEKCKGSIRSYHWDYWVFSSQRPWVDPEIKQRFPDESKSVLANASFVRNLPDDFVTSAFLLDGKWHDIHDFGWRMMGTSTWTNKSAMKKWIQCSQEILRANPEKIALRIFVHS